MIGCMVSINDLADRAPRPLRDDELLDIGGHRMRWIDTPHVPHGWEAGLLFDETTGTLFCGDLLTRWGAYAAMTTADILGPALAADAGDDYGSWSLRPAPATPSVASPRSTSRPSRPCTARRSVATAPPRSAASPTPSMLESRADR